MEERVLYHNGAFHQALCCMRLARRRANRATTFAGRKIQITKQKGRLFLHSPKSAKTEMLERKNNFGDELNLFRR